MPRGIYDRSKAKPNSGIFRDGHAPTKGAFGKGHANPLEWREKMSAYWLEAFKDKTIHPRWKGDRVGYGGLHVYIHKAFGSAIKCDLDKTHTDRKYEWANIGSYSRDRKEWIQLCISCHRRLDANSTRMKDYEKRITE